MMRLLILVTMIIWSLLISVESPFAQAEKLRAASSFPPCENAACTLELELKIGGDTDDEDQFLYGPSDIAVDGRGNLFVLDSRNFCIKKFDPDGICLETFGRQGEGPGEMSIVIHMAIDPDDNIVVYDLGNRRFTIFDNDGRYVDSHKFMDQVWKFEVDTSGRCYVEIRQMDLATRGDTWVKIYRLSPDFNHRAGVDSARIRDNKYITEPLLTNVPVPFHPDLYWAVMPDGYVVTARSEDYTIRIFNPDAKLVKEFRCEGERVKVTDEDKKRHFDGISFTREDYTREGAPDFIRRETVFPEFKPYFSLVAIDGAGRILVRTFVNRDGRDLYDVFSSEGSFLGRLAIPPLGRSALFADGRVYALSSSEEELPSVERYRLR